MISAIREIGVYVLAFLLGIFLVQNAFGAGCEGYSEKRVPLESQSWWSDARVPFPGAHIHLGTCFPLHQKVRGVIHFDTVIRLHSMQGNGAVTLLRVQIFGNGGSSAFTTSKAISLRCDVPDCAFIVPIDVDTRRQTWDGLWEFRMTANVPKTALGHRMYQTTRWHAFLDNGKPVKNGTSALRSPGAGGWYTGVEYENVFCGINDSGFKFVSEPQSGVVSVTCSFSKPTSFASVDPNFHAVPYQEGIVYLRSTGGTKTITIDTRELINGPHVLFLRTDVNGTNPVGMGSGAIAMPFTVSNP